MALGLAVTAIPTYAAKVDFRPVLSFGIYRDGNIQVVGGNPTSDWSGAIVADLDVERTTPTGSFEFLYRARYLGYERNSDLNYLGNVLATSYSKALSRRSEFRTSAVASRSDYQGIAALTADRPTTFVPRTTVTRAYGNVGGSIGVAQRGLVDWDVRASTDRYKDVPGVTFNDNSSAATRVGWRYELSERSTLGFAVDFSWFGYQVTDDSVNESIIFTGTNTLGRSMGITYDIGATNTTTAGASTTSGTLRVTFERELTRESRLSTGIRHFVTPGSGLQGATTDSGAWISFTQSGAQARLYGALDGAYWLRRAVQTSTTSLDTDTLNLSGVLGWSFNRFLSLSAVCVYYYQNDRSGVASGLDTRYASYGLFLRWAIRGLVGTSAPGARFD